MRYLMLIVTFFLVLTGFSHQEHLKISEVQTTINKSQKTIRYDFKIKNTGKKAIGNEFDYPGYQYGGIEIIVVPNKNLENLMEMMPNKKYKKMVPAGFGGQGFILPNQEGEFHAEYKFKNIKDLELIKKFALDGTLLILDGTKIIAKLELTN